MHDQRIGRRNIQPAFDDGGRDKHVVLPVVEGAHHLLQLGRAHLAVADDELHFGDLFAQELLDVRQVFQARRDIVGLTAAIFLAQQGLAHQHRVPRRHIGPHRQTIDRRRGDDRHFANAGQGHLQGARDRRGGQGQQMHVGPKRLQLLLVLDAEMLLLVHDHQAQVAEPDLFGQDRMGADHDLDRAVLQARPRLRRLLARHHPRQLTHLDRPAGEPFGEGLEVLTRQQGGRGHHGHLLPRHGHHESRPQRNLRLAEADVAADQAIHRHALAQVFQHVADGVQLVVGLFIREARAEFGEQTGRRGDGLRLAQRALGGQGDQPLGHGAQPLLGLGLARLPARAPQPIQLSPFGIRAVTGQKVDVLDRQIQFALPGVHQLQAVVRRLLDIQRLQALVTADAVIQVDDQIAGRQGRGLGQEVRGPALLPGPRQTVAQDVGFGDYGHIVGDEAMFDRQDAPQIQVLGRRLHIGPVAHGDDVIQPMVGQHGRQSLGRAFGPAGEQHPLALAFQRLGVGGDSFEQIDAVLRPFGREGSAQPSARVLAAVREGREPPHRPARQRLIPVARVHIELLRRQGAIGDCAPLRFRRLRARLIGVGDQVPTLATRRLDLIVQKHLRLIRQIVEQGVQAVVEQRQPLLHALTPRALADRRIQRIVSRRPEQVQVSGAEARNGGGVQQGLRHRRQRHGLHLPRRTLCLGIKGADRFQFGAKHIQPHRLGEAGRIDVHHPAAHGELPAFRNGGGADIAVGGEIPLQRLNIQVAADLGLETGLKGHGPGRRALHGCRNRRDDQHRRVVRLALRQPRQGRHPLRRNARRGAQPVIGQAIPGRILQHFNILREELKRLNEGARPLIIPRDEQGDVARRLQTLGRNQGVQPLRRPAQVGVGPHHLLIHQPIPLLTSAATWARMKARTLAITGVSNSGGVGSRSMIQP